MVQPTALNLVIVGLMMVIFNFLWRMGASALLARNPESGLGKGMSTIIG